MKKLSKAVKILAIAAALSFACGCIPHTELDDQGIATAVGIDFSDGEYEVTVQYFNMEGMGGNAPVDPTKSNVINVSGKGDSVSVALESASAKCGRSFMYGITTLIVLGREAAEQDILKTLSFAESYYESNPSVLVAAAEEKAADILGVKFKEGMVSVERLEKLIRNAEEKGLCSAVTVIDLLADQHRPFAATALPVLKTADTGSDASDDGKDVLISGGMLIADRKNAGELTLSDLSALQLLNPDPVNTAVSADMDGEKVNVTVYDISTDIDHDFEEGRLVLDIDIRANGRYTDSQLENKDASFSEAVEKVCGGILKERVTEAVRNTVFRYGCDPMRLKYIIASDNYHDWLAVRNDFGGYLRNAKVQVECDIDIDRFGIVH
ncbi:MAG: Ger(x)C family spore germination protein [Ruminiclostridium sp.]|nr:Ger(x)C family spore germination protein [Ruminiclostridium sp.]